MLIVCGAKLGEWGGSVITLRQQLRLFSIADFCICS